MASLVFFGGVEILLHLLGIPQSAPGAIHVQVEGGRSERPGSMRDDPELLWSFRPNQRVEEHVPWLPRPYRYETNSLGWRSPELGPAPGRPLVVCVGDSVTAGFGVGNAESYPRVLEGLLHEQPRFATATVVNMGVYGYSSEQGRVVFDRAIRSLRPDAIVLSFGLNDRRSADVPDRVLIHGESRLRSFQLLMSHSRTYRALRDALVTRVDEQAATGMRVGPERYAENLRAIASAARAASCAIVFFAPTSRREEGEWNPAYAAPMPVTAYRHIMSEVAADQGVPYVDEPALSGRLPESAQLFLDAAHPGARGLCLLAQAVARRLAPNLPPGRPDGTAE